MGARAGMTGSAVTLRPGVPADAAVLARIHLAARASAQPRFDEPHDEAAVAAWLADVLLSRHDVTVAAAGGVPIGYLGRAAAEVLHLYVAPPWQGRGVGGRLLDVAKAAAPAGLYLVVFEANLAARAFYARHGFRAGERRPGTANEEGVPDIRTVWTPDPFPQIEGENA